MMPIKVAAFEKKAKHLKQTLSSLLVVCFDTWNGVHRVLQQNGHTFHLLDNWFATYKSQNKVPFFSASDIAVISESFQD